MLYAHATILTLNAHRDIISDGTLLVQGNRITDIGKTDDLISKYPEKPVTDLRGRIVFPGLVNSHVHCAQSLLRGMWVDFYFSSFKV